MGASELDIELVRHLFRASQEALKLGRRWERASVVMAGVAGWGGLFMLDASHKNWHEYFFMDLMKYISKEFPTMGWSANSDGVNRVSVYCADRSLELGSPSGPEDKLRAVRTAIAYMGAASQAVVEFGRSRYSYPEYRFSELDCKSVQLVVEMLSTAVEVLGEVLDDLEAHEEPDVVPRWDAELRQLWFGDSQEPVREFSPQASAQIELLLSFERRGWTESIPSPWRSPRKLQQTVGNLNKGLPADSPIGFDTRIGRAVWFPRRNPTRRTSQTSP